MFRIRTRKRSISSYISEFCWGISPIPSNRPGEKPTKNLRKIERRHPFDIYEDQLEVLKKRSIDEQVQGGIGSQSAMVREALNDYLAKTVADRNSQVRIP